MWLWDYAKPGNKFINGHNGRNVKYSDEICEKRSESIKRYYKIPGARKKHQMQ